MNRNKSNKLNSVFVTGGTGFLGSRLIDSLVNEGYFVKALVRKQSNIKNLERPKVEIYYGDVADLNSLISALKDVDFVVHAAADTKGNNEESELITIQGTKNILELCKKNKIKKLIYISSCSVYGVADFKKNQVIDEKALLEKHPEKRGYYSSAKLKAEKLVLKAINENTNFIVSLRPGTIWGPGGKLFTPMLGLTLKSKFFIVFGTGKFILPLVYLDNLVSAIISTLKDNKSINCVFNVLDNTQMSKKEYIKRVFKKVYPKAKVIYIPYFLLAPMIFLQEIIMNVFEKVPFITWYRFLSSQKPIRIDSSKIRKQLNWQEIVDREEAINQTIKFNWYNSRL